MKEVEKIFSSDLNLNKVRYGFEKCPGAREALRVIFHCISHPKECRRKEDIWLSATDKGGTEYKV